MKNKITTIAASLGLMFAGAACSEQWTPPTVDEGTLSLEGLTVEVDKQQKPVVSDASRAIVEIDKSNFIVTITPADGTEPTVYTYGSMPEVVTLKTGSYGLTIESHKVKDAEWENPYYTTSTTFEIKKNSITRLDPQICVFKSIGVAVSYTDELRALLGDDVNVSVIANDMGRLDYSRDETRVGYFKAIEGSTTMVVTLTGTIAGQNVNFRKAYTDLEAGQRRMIVFKTIPGPQPPEQTGTVNPGGITIDSDLDVIDVNGNVNTGEDPEQPKDPWDNGGGDDPNPPTPPTPGGDAATFTSEFLDLEGQNNVDNFGSEDGQKPAVVNIHCEKGFAKLEVHIESAFLTPEMLQGVGLDTDFDLANPGSFAEGLEGLGFQVGDAVKGKTDSTFDITGFMPLILESGVHKFHITVTDAEGGVSTLILTLVKN